MNDATAEHNGSWISEDKAHTGFWNYYDGTDLEGTWGFDDLSLNGTWATDENDHTIKFDTTPVSNDTCVDLDVYNGLTDRNRNNCSFYYEVPEECGLFDTSAFYAADLCCACSGGVIETLGQVGA